MTLQRTMMGLMGLMSLAVGPVAQGQLVLNEANAVGSSQPFIDVDLNKPYEGYDYGIVPYSGNTNSPTAAVNPGNPFGDVDAAQGGVQSSLPNGWNGTTGWARVNGNGGDWVELVVTEDFADLRGYTLFWENDDIPAGGDGTIGADPEERGFVKFSNNAVWNNVRAGTIITISENNFVAEVRDGYPNSAPLSNQHNTGHLYDLNTDTSFDPIGIGTPTSPQADGDYHRHFHLDEGGDTTYFEAGSDIRVDNDDWRMYIFDATNSDPVSDKTTGLVQNAVGESAPGWGGGGVNNQEIIALNADPVSGVSAGQYEDVDFSTFGRPNLYNVNTEATLDGVQDFSTQRAWVSNTLIGDSDYDGDVDGDNVFTVVQNFTGNGGASDKSWSQGSFDGDGDVDGDDYFAAVQNFTGSGGGSAPSVTAATTTVSAMSGSASDPDLIYDFQTGNVTLFAEAFFDTYQIRTLDEADFDESAFQFAWTPSGGLTDLTNSEAFQLDAVAAFIAQTINGQTLFDLGNILPTGLSQAQLDGIFDEARWANGTNAFGNFDLVTVPEPTTLVLLALGGLMVAGRRRKA